MEENTTEVTDLNACVIDSTTLLATPSSPHRIEAKNNGFVGKIPVTIAQPKVQIYIDNTLRLPYYVLAITNESKNVVLTRCQLTPDGKKNAKLLINGFVRKTIQYAVPSNRTRQGISGDIRFSTFDIPFKCFANVDYLTEPDLCFDELPRSINIMDSSYLGADTSQYAFVNSQFLNERIFIELKSVTIRDIGKKNNLSDFTNGNISRSVFRVIDESMVVELVLRIIQNQMVEIPASENKKSEGSDGNVTNNSNNKDHENDNDRNNCDGDEDNRGRMDERYDLSSEEKKDGRNARDEKYYEINKEKDYKEIGELKLSVPTRLIQRLKKHFNRDSKK